MISSGNALSYAVVRHQVCLTRCLLSWSSYSLFWNEHQIFSGVIDFEGNKYTQKIFRHFFSKRVYLCNFWPPYKSSPFKKEMIFSLVANYFPSV